MALLRITKSPFPESDDDDSARLFVLCSFSLSRLPLLTDDFQDSFSISFFTLHSFAPFSFIFFSPLDFSVIKRCVMVLQQAYKEWELHKKSTRSDSLANKLLRKWRWNGSKKDIISSSRWFYAVFFSELSLCPARDDREWQPRKKIYVWKISENKNIWIKYFAKRETRIQKFIRRNLSRDGWNEIHRP